MALYFLDSSAIVKRYFQEQGHDWIETLHDPNQGHVLYIAQAALVEVVASICRKAREQDIPFEERNATIDDFRRDVRDSIVSGWLTTPYILLLATCVVHIDYEPTMPFS